TAHSRENGHVLPAIGPAVRDRLPDNARTALELPQNLSAARIHGLEPAIHGAIKGHVAGGHHGAAPDRKVFLDAPDFLASHRIPGVEFSAMSARARIHADLRS